MMINIPSNLAVTIFALFALILEHAVANNDIFTKTISSKSRLLRNTIHPVLQGDRRSTVRYPSNNTKIQDYTKCKEERSRRRTEYDEIVDENHDDGVVLQNDRSSSYCSNTPTKNIDDTAIEEDQDEEEYYESYQFNNNPTKNIDDTTIEGKQIEEEEYYEWIRDEAYYEAKSNEEGLSQQQSMYQKYHPQITTSINDNYLPDGYIIKDDVLDELLYFLCSVVAVFLICVSYKKFDDNDKKGLIDHEFIPNK